MWTTLLKTVASPLGGKPIIPAAISNLEVKLESDRSTKFNANYVNPTKNRDMHVHLVRVPGQSAHIRLLMEQGNMILHSKLETWTLKHWMECLRSRLKELLLENQSRDVKKDTMCKFSWKEEIRSYFNLMLR